MIALPEELTHRQASACLGQLRGAMGQGQAPVELDAGALVRFDSSALAVVLECRRLAVSAGRPFQVLRAPARLMQLAGLYGVGELLSSP